MSDLGEVLGTLLVSLARARQIADAETAALAEWYRSHPLLEGLSVPRVRVPEMVLEIPMLIQTDDPGEPNQLADPGAIAAAAKAELLASAKRAGVDIPLEMADAFETELVAVIAQLKGPTGAPITRSVPREAVARAAETAVTRVLSGMAAGDTLRGEKLKSVIADVRMRVHAIAEVKAGIPPSISATLVTSEVKEKSTPNTVARIRITVREEGLEWSVDQAQDGTSTRRLTPE